MERAANQGIPPRARTRTRRGERPLPVPNDVTLASTPMRTGPLSVAEEQRVEGLMTRCDNNVQRLLLLDGFKRLGVGLATDFDLDPIGKFFKLLCEFRGQEGMRQLGALQTHVMPNARIELDFERDSETLRLYSSEEFTDAVNTRVNFGQRCDFPLAYAKLVGDRYIPMCDSGSVKELIGGNTMQMARITIGGVTFSAGIYGIIDSVAHTRDRRYTENTYPSAKAKIEEVMGLSLGADIRRNDELSIAERQLIHFLVSQLTYDNKTRTMTSFHPHLVADIMDFTYARRTAHKELLGWLREHLQPKIRLGTGTINQINVLTLINGIEPALLRKQLDDLRQKYGPNLMDSEVPQVVLEFQKELQQCPYKSFNYKHREEAEAATFAISVLGFARRCFGDASVPYDNTMDGIWEGCMTAKRVARAKRVNDNYSYERTHIDNFSFLFEKSSTARKAKKQYDIQLVIADRWKKAEPNLPYAFVHLGTTRNNFTDLSVKLAEQDLGVFKFDLKPNPKQGISRMDLTERVLPKVLEGLNLFIFDDSMPVKSGEVVYSYDHENHNELTKLKFECWRDILLANKNKVKVLTMKDWLPTLVVGGNKQFLFENYFDLLMDVASAGGFDTIYVDNDNGRLGNCEVFITFIKYPKGPIPTNQVYGEYIPYAPNAVPDGDVDENGFFKFKLDGPEDPQAAEKLEVFEDMLYDKFMGMLAYSTGISVLRTLGACIWTLPPFREHDMGGIARGHVLDYSSETIILRSKDDYDPLEEFCTRCLVKRPNEQFVPIRLGELLRDVRINGKDEINIVKSLQRVFPNVKHSQMQDVMVRYGDLFAYWVAQSETSGHRLFRAPVVHAAPRRKVLRRRETEEDVASVSASSSVEHEESVDPEELAETVYDKGKAEEEEIDDKPVLSRTLTQQFTEGMMTEGTPFAFDSPHSGSITPGLVGQLSEMKFGEQ